MEKNPFSQQIDLLADILLVSPFPNRSNCGIQDFNALFAFSQPLVVNLIISFSAETEFPAYGDLKSAIRVLRVRILIFEAVYNVLSQSVVCLDKLVEVWAYLSSLSFSPGTACVYGSSTWKFDSSGIPSFSEKSRLGPAGIPGASLYSSRKSVSKSQVRLRGSKASVA